MNLAQRTLAQLRIGPATANELLAVSRCRYRALWNALTQLEDEGLARRSLDRRQRDSLRHHSRRWTQI